MTDRMHECANMIDDERSCVVTTTFIAPIAVEDLPLLSSSRRLWSFGGAPKKEKKMQRPDRGS